MTGVAVFTVILVLAPLIAIFGYLLYRGMGSINWAFLTRTPKPVGEAGGGMANAIVGSAFILALASILGVPIGVGAGIYVAEYGRNRFGDAIRFTADVLNGVPSIVIGIVACYLRWCVLYAEAFLGVGRRRGFGNYDDSDDHAHDRRHASAGASGFARGCLWVGHSALACHSFHYSSHRYIRRDNWNYAGLCPGCRRNRSAALYCIR